MEFVTKNQKTWRANAFDQLVVVPFKKNKLLNSIKYYHTTIFWPINEAQKMFEANNVTVDLVYSRWLNLQNHINQSATFNRFERDRHDYLALRFS